MNKEGADIIAAVVTAILALVAALAWNSFIQNIIKSYVGTENSLIGTAVYAVIMTVAAIWISMYIHKLAHKVK